MDNYTFYNPTKIIFGKGTISQVGGQILAFGGKKALLHYGGGSIKKSGIYDTVVASLRASGIDFVELPGVVPNPRLSLIREGMRIVKEQGIDFVLAVGGGSVIDSSKAIAFGSCLPQGKDIWNDYFMQPSAVIPGAMPLGVVLTIPAAGSESSNSCVVTNEETGFKRGVKTEHYLPRFSILDPEVSYTLPPFQTACGAIDIHAHMFERYFTPVERTDVTDQLLEGAMRSVIDISPRILREPMNYDYRAEVMYAGTIAHNNSLNPGRGGGDWGSHQIEHELSGQYDMTHGAGLAIVIPAWMRYVSRKNPTRFVQYAVRVWGITLPLSDTFGIIDAMIERQEQWYHSLGIPTRLSDLGHDSTYFNEMARKALVNKGAIGAYCKLQAQDIVEILKLAL
ncbi:MAG: iron-containing alcohol dehydrogenase [Sphaerochaetaceae bacterium]|nr:iron-containing alcohol dehydrogenase [Sphaerochaetaceae bacterium]